MLRHSNDDQLVNQIAAFLRAKASAYDQMHDAFLREGDYGKNVGVIMGRLVAAQIVAKPLTGYDEHEIADAIQDAFYLITPYDESIEEADRLKSIAQLASHIDDMLAHWQRRVTAEASRKDYNPFTDHAAQGMVQAYSLFKAELAQGTPLKTLYAQQQQSLKFWKAQGRMECFREPNNPIRWGIAAGHKQAIENFLHSIEDVIEWQQLLSE